MQRLTESAMSAVGHELATALVESRWWPRVEPFPQSLLSPKVGQDLLPILAQASRYWNLKKDHGHFARVARLLDESQRNSNGMRLTSGWPGLSDRPLLDWIGPWLMFWPRGVPSGRKVAWVSSRLGRAIDERPDWLAVLRTAAAKLDSQHDLLLTAPQTTTDRFLERAAVLFGLRLLRVELEETRSFADWLVRLRRHIEQQSVTAAAVEPQERDDDFYSVCVSPLIPCEKAHSQISPDDLENWPLADRLLIAAADQVTALQIRPNGNLHELLRRRLRDATFPAGSVWLALGDQLVPSNVADELQSLGAVGWVLQAKEGLRVEQRTNVEGAAADVGHVFNVAVMVRHDGNVPTREWHVGNVPHEMQLRDLSVDYLVHGTRRRFGPWPEQSEGEFVDELLLSDVDTSHSAFAALARIVRQQKLTASSAGIRNGFRVVSFTSTPLDELVQRRTFRAHRGRWDCEPYGVCIRRAWLEQCGARPVIYGDDSDWATLGEVDRTFFQLRQTRSRDGGKVIDWTIEREWRVPRDVDLSQAPPDAVTLFVPRESEARQLSAICPWHLVVVQT